MRAVIASRDNPRVKRWARLVRDGHARREEGKVLLEGIHLVAEALQAGIEPIALLVSESALERPEVRRLVGQREPVVLGERVFKALADAETPQGIAAEVPIPRMQGKGDWAFLEAVQDPANVGAIIRTAAAFGIGMAVLDQACADPWSPKALRAGMGGHFKLGIQMVPDLAPILEGFGGTVICTVLEEGTALHEAPLEGRLAWVFGSEARGASAAARERAQVKVRIPMKPGNDSLNVAAAAAICLYEAFRRKEAAKEAGEGSRGRGKSPGPGQ